MFLHDYGSRYLFSIFKAPAAEVEVTPLLVSPLFTFTMLHGKATIKVDYNHVAMGTAQSQNVLYNFLTVTVRSMRCSFIGVGE